MIRVNHLTVLAVVLCVGIGASGGQAREVQSTDSPITFAGLGPNLAVGPDGTAILSYIESRQSGHALVYRIVTPDGQSEPQVVASGDNWFVNWADFPSVVPINDNLWAAHWLVRRSAGGYAYDAYASVSSDRGQAWSEPFVLHDDGTDTEHGFVTLFPSGDAIGAVWLDGRNMPSEHAADGHATGGGMSLRSGVFDATGEVRQRQLVDDLTCDCCQTDVALTADGPVAVYRDRSDSEIRDIYVSRLIDGVWRRGEAVNDDDWMIAGCPVNGPVVKALDNRVIVSWFTAADGVPLVKSAWSSDSGASFGPPVTVSEDGAIGYVGSALLGEQESVVSWLCKSVDGANSICYRSVGSGGQVGKIRHLPTPTTLTRMSVPQIARLDTNLMFVWTERIEDIYYVSSARVPIESVADSSIERQEN